MRITRMGKTFLSLLSEHKAVNVKSNVKLLPISLIFETREGRLMTPAFCTTITRLLCRASQEKEEGKKEEKERPTTTVSARSTIECNTCVCYVNINHVQDFLSISE